MHVARQTLRLQKRLRERLVEDAACVGPGQGAYPLQPIGHLQSCFSQRNGTPRQPLLVPAARAQLVLRCAAAWHVLGRRWSECYF